MLKKRIFYPADSNAHEKPLKGILRASVCDEKSHLK
jgi:hypothetical protein